MDFRPGCCQESSLIKLSLVDIRPGGFWQYGYDFKGQQRSEPLVSSGELPIDHQPTIHLSASLAGPGATSGSIDQAEIAGHINLPFGS